MPKSYFWPAALVVMGLIFLADQVGLLPKDFWNLWPLILIVVGLGGLLTADRKDWIVGSSSPKPKTTAKKPASKRRKK